MFKLKKTDTLIVLCLALVLGLVLGRYWVSADTTFILIMILLVVLARPTRAKVLAILALALTMGLVRGSSVRQERHIYESLYDHKIPIIARVADDPSLNEKGHLIFNVEDAHYGDLRLPGKIRVRSHYASLKRGYQVHLYGEVERWGYGIQSAQIGFATVTTLSTQVDWLEQIRQQFFAGMRTALPEPDSSMGLGLLVGIRALIPKPLQEQLALIGLSHIVAVSGYNLTIIVEAVRKLLAKHSRFLATSVSLWMIAGFMLMTGMSAAIVRAGVVSVLAVLAGYYGHRFRAMVLITLAAAITAFINPDYVLKDLGWQLSFLAFYGIMVLAPLVKERFFPRAGTLMQIMIESLAAQLMTFPLIMLTFGTLSLMAPLANILVLPLIPFAMLASFVAGVGGILLPFYSAWLALPATWILGLILRISESLSGWEMASIRGTTGMTVVVTTYLVVIILVLLLQLGIRRSKAPRMV